MSLEDKLVIELNKSFYNNISQQFSRSRVKPWEGWESLVSYFKEGYTIADIGCGDGRFLTFLEGKNVECVYDGYDISSKLLEEAKLQHPKANFYEQNIIETNINRYYDVITGFGIMHHIPNFISLNNFFNNLIPYINKNGLLILTFWKFDTSKERTFNDKARELGFTLEINDYLLDWGGTGENLRFCHLYSENEINKIVDLLHIHGLELINKFNADKSNLYLVLKKQN